MLHIRRVVGASMLPTLAAGRVVVSFSLKPRVGDVVIAHLANREVIKRVHSVQAEQYDLRGDNKQLSTDSRTYGSVERSEIIGRVIWPRLGRT